MKSAIVWNLLGFLGTVAVATWACSVGWKLLAQPIEHSLTAMLILLTAFLAFYLGAENEEN
jgi:hypothetical protein